MATQVSCQLCGKPIDVDIEIWESPIMGCEYNVHPECLKSDARKEFVEAETLYFYGNQ